MDLERLRQAHAQEQRDLKQEHSRQSQKLARDVKEGRDKQQFRKEMGQTLSDDFQERVKKRIRRSRKREREERESGKDKGRGRERE